MKNLKKNLFQFGETVKGFDVHVFNEREIRAGAGIMFLFAMIAFMNAFLLKNFYFIKIFVIAFLIDFLIRLVINPKYSPFLVVGRFVVQNQTPEYSGAPQKKFAWILGLSLAITMFFLVVIFNVTGPVNLIICLACLTFLFFESVFGICLGCLIYKYFNKKKAKLCPGGSCELKFKEDIQMINWVQIVITVLFVVLIGFLAFSGLL
ncbi:DUF4395 domain-containing protein [Candidatus Woesearchaeota archaeon]|jgi:hypothetical protein|nr:DUF4395 domain-containing protein [Candidatus Woesearchaeota archaeon]